MESETQDNHIAQTICQQLGENPDVKQVLVKGDLLQVHVTETFYHRLARNRDLGRKLVLTLMRRMKDLTGLSEVTVRIFCNNEKVMEGKVKPWGGDNVTYMYDL